MTLPLAASAHPFSSGNFLARLRFPRGLKTGRYSAICHLQLLAPKRSAQPSLFPHPRWPFQRRGHFGCRSLRPVFPQENSDSAWLQKQCFQRSICWVFSLFFNPKLFTTPKQLNFGEIGAWKSQKNSTQRSETKYGEDAATPLCKTGIDFPRLLTKNRDEERLSSRSLPRLSNQIGSLARQSLPGLRLFPKALRRLPDDSRCRSCRSTPRSSNRSGRDPSH